MSYVKEDVMKKQAVLASIFSLMAAPAFAAGNEAPAEAVTAVPQLSFEQIDTDGDDMISLSEAQASGAFTMETAAGAGAAEGGGEEVDLPSDVGGATEREQVGTAAGTGTSGDLIEGIENTSGLATEEADDLNNDDTSGASAGQGTGAAGGGGAGR
jgi:hypothetical protein